MRKFRRLKKQDRVAAVFTSVAGKYDLMNDVMSFGIHHLWKKLTIEMCGLRPGHKVLDLAGGTGDLAIKQARLVGESGQVVLADINAAMLQQGRDRVIDKGLVNRITSVAVQCRNPALCGQSFRLHHHRLWFAQRHRQSHGIGIDATHIETRWSVMCARIFQTRLRATGKNL